MSARARIVGWMLAVVGLALSVSVFAAWTVLLARLDSRVDAELANEMEKLRWYARTSSADPETLLKEYLAVNAPDRHETFFMIVDGAVPWRTYAEPLPRWTPTRRWWHGWPPRPRPSGTGPTARPGRSAGRSSR
ncbi:hypothetical protein ACFQX6_51075 [Streptosporangium lutulentum]